MELSDLKYYERQNIRRRYKCNPVDYLKALEAQHGRCIMCNEPPKTKRGLTADTYRTRSGVRLVCHHCLYFIELRAKRQQGFLQILENMNSYLELENLKY